MSTKMESILQEIRNERESQTLKWGVQDNSTVEWIAILTEEVGEAAKEAVDYYFGNKIINKENWPSADENRIQFNRLMNYRKELIQVAAVAVQAIECLDRAL